MIRHHLRLASVLCALALSACNVTSGQVTGILVGVQTIATAAGQKELVAKAQQRVAAACGFLPTAQTVIAIAKTFSKDAVVTLDLVADVAAGICAAVANPTVAYTSGRSQIRREGTYRGVPVRGQRVNGR